MASSNELLPRFVLTQLPHGIAGLVIASIFAASMAVMSAGVNSLATATTVDIYTRVLRPGKSSTHYAMAGRLGTFLWGSVVTALGLLAGRAGDLAVAYSRVSSILVGPMLGLFLLGILTRRTNAIGALTGSVLSALTGAILLATSPISFFYLSGIGTCLAVSLDDIYSAFRSPAPQRTTLTASHFLHSR